MELSSFRTLGRSGLPVSPLALGTMTFGNKAWGSTDETSEAIFNEFLEAGGNFIDTADVYSGGRSEELIGRFVAARKLRDRIVLATKFSFSGGNGRKNMHRALEGSLRRLGTDYIDLYWMHVWDRVTPAEEMLQSMVEMVQVGKIRYFGLSDVPAWYAARMVTLAQAHGVPAPIALQLEYSLVERTIENEHVPAARELGMGITPWSPLAFGFLTGKYRREANGHAKTGGNGNRLDTKDDRFQKFTDRHWRVLDGLRDVSEGLGVSMAEVALAWVAGQPGVTSTILGASSVEQWRTNVKSLQCTLGEASMAQLAQISATEPLSPYAIFSDAVSRGIFSGATVKGWRES